MISQKVIKSNLPPPSHPHPPHPTHTHRHKHPLANNDPLETEIERIYFTFIKFGNSLGSMDVFLLYLFCSETAGSVEVGVVDRLLFSTFF